MNTKSLVRCGLLLVGIGLAGSAFGNTGWLSSYVYVWDGTGDSFYDLNGVDQPENFDSAILGTNLPIDYTLFINAEINAWADGGDSFSNMRLHWRVNAGEWQAIESPSIFNTGDNNWRGNPTGGSLTGLGVGTHTVDVYLSRRHIWNDGNYTTYLDTNGDTGVVPTTDVFSASFSVIPEPGSIVLMSVMGAAFATVALLRRKKV